MLILNHAPGYRLHRLRFIEDEERRILTKAFADLPGRRGRFGRSWRRLKKRRRSSKGASSARLADERMAAKEAVRVAVGRLYDLHPGGVPPRPEQIMTIVEFRPVEWSEGAPVRGQP